jgi:hypothetical protein
MSEEQSAAAVSSAEGSTGITDTGSNSSNQGFTTNPADIATKGSSWSDTMRAGAVETTPQNVPEVAKKQEQEQVKNVIAPDVIEYLKTKGFENPDPSALDVNSVISTFRESDRKAQELQKSQETIKKIEESARAAASSPKHGENTPLSPLDEFENIHKYQVSLYCQAHGVEDLDQLAQTQPALAAAIKEQYVLNRQQSWEATQSWNEQQKQIQEKAKQDRQEAEQRFQDTKNTANVNVLRIKESFPQFDSAMQRSGLSKINDYLEQTAFWPSSYVMSNPEMAQVYANLAKAYDFYENRDSYKESIIKEHELALQKARSGALPTPGGSGSAGAMPTGAGKQGNWFNSLKTK